MKLEFKVSEILRLFPDSATEGSLDNISLKGIASLEEAVRGDVSFLGNLKYKKQALASNASVLWYHLI